MARLVLSALLLNSVLGVCDFRKPGHLANDLLRLADAHLLGNRDAFKELSALEGMRGMEGGGALSFVLFSAAGNSDLPTLASRVYETALFGPRAPGSVPGAGVLHLDLGRHAAAAEAGHLDVDAAKVEIRRQLVAAAARCPLRTLVTVSGAHMLRGGAVQVLDAFMGVLDGRRGTLAGATPASFTFLLLMPTLAAAPVAASGGDPPGDWKEQLERAWAFAGVEFTPGALVGRLSAAVSLRAPAQVDMGAALAQLSAEERVAPSGEPGSYVVKVAVLVLLALLVVRSGATPSTQTAHKKKLTPANPNPNPKGSAPPVAAPTTRRTRASKQLKKERF